MLLPEVPLVEIPGIEMGLEDLKKETSALFLPLVSKTGGMKEKQVRL